MITQARNLLSQPPAVSIAGSSGNKVPQEGDVFLQMLTYVQNLLASEEGYRAAPPFSSASAAPLQSLLPGTKSPVEATPTALNPVHDEQERRVLENILQRLQEILPQLPIDILLASTPLPNTEERAAIDLLATGGGRQHGEALPLLSLSVLSQQITTSERPASPSASTVAAAHQEPPTSPSLPSPPAQDVPTALQQTETQLPFILPAIPGEAPRVEPAPRPATATESFGVTSAPRPATATESFGVTSAPQPTTMEETFTTAATAREVSGAATTSRPTTNTPRPMVPPVSQSDALAPAAAGQQPLSAPISTQQEGEPLLPAPNTSTPESMHHIASTALQDREVLTAVQQEGEISPTTLTSFEGGGRPAASSGNALRASKEEQPSTVLQRARPLDTETATKLLGRPLPRNTVLLQLEPPELGQLLVRVRLTDEGVTASFWAKSSEVRSLLHAHFPTLNQALSQQGFDAQQISISLAAEGPVDQSGQFGHQQSAFQSFAHGRDQNGIRHHADGSEAEQTVTSSHRSNGLVDVVI